VTERTILTLSILAGAVVGGVAGFLMFTDRGRQFRGELQPHLDELTRELRDLQDMALRVRQSALDSWQQLEAFVGELGRQDGPWAGDERRH
jgi:hypothetical protein